MNRIDILLYLNSIQSKVQRSGIVTTSTTPDPGKKWQINIEHHKREPRNQLFPSRWPQGTYKQTFTKA